jgi:hypothetical protein
VGGDEIWKGEHLISAKTINNRKEATRLVQTIWHMNRRSQGVPAPGAKKHRALVQSAIRDTKK